MEESERERVGESESEGGERVVLCASDGAENIGCLEHRNSRWKSSFEVESKIFEIEAEEKKAKCKSLLWKGKEGCLRGLSKWVRDWRERGRIYSLLRDENKGGCFIHLGVEDLEKKRFNIFIPKGRGGKGGWVAMVETLRALGVATERKESQKDEAMPLVSNLGKSFVEVVKLQNRNGRSVARVEVSHKDLSRNLKRLDHCLVGSWDPKAVKGEDLRSWGNQMARSWGLKGNLGLAKLERGKVLLEFEMVGEKCGGFLAIDSQTKRLEELQWARILVKLIGEEILSIVEIGVKGVCYSLTLWWEVRPVMRVLLATRRGKNSGVEEKVENDVSARTGKHVLEEVDNTRIETHLQSADGTRGQTVLAPKVGPSSLEGSRRLKALETIGAPGLAGMDDCRGPSQSLMASGKQIEEELYSVERSRTDNALFEEALRYECAPNPGGLLVFGSSPSPSFFFGRTPLGGIATFLGMTG
ncbi:hypothetical protein CK203_102160 [Vitis vinifera]|uniref:DUF4283 domain-containing protein n=1 Tax=Vitis vinifera TaxID=29760 RepID=A0A438ELZ3_VITVI|nr:hypothetical protein CK203_102160 [Vitis vinifera]